MKHETSIIVFFYSFYQLTGKRAKRNFELHNFADLFKESAKLWHIIMPMLRKKAKVWPKSARF